MVAGRQVELTCHCGYTERQELGAPVDERCARCNRKWR
jgi:hypothetical protein